MVELPRSDVSGRPPGQPRPSGGAAHAPSGGDDRGAHYSVYSEEGVSAWAWFTGGLLGLIGLFQIMAGTVALAGAGYYTAPTRSLVVDASYTTWGWVHLIIGIVALVTGGGVAFGSIVARVVGVVLAVVSAVVNLAFIPASPFGATVIIGLDVFLIYAITVHGGEPNEAR